jgi:short subunit dehydrogenase
VAAELAEPVDDDDRPAAERVTVDQLTPEAVVRALAALQGRSVAGTRARIHGTLAGLCAHLVHQGQVRVDPLVAAGVERPKSGRLERAERLAADGAAAAFLARSADDLMSTQTRITQLGGIALAVPMDLADAAAIEAAVARVVAELGRIDVLVNAAATDVPGPVEALDQQDWDRVIAVITRTCQPALIPPR